MDPAVGDSVLCYDGVCALCNGFVRFVLRRDPQRRFRFAPLAGRFAQAVLARHAEAVAGRDTMVLVLHAGTASERVLVRSTAALHLVAALTGPCRLLAVFRLVPRPLRDLVYDLVARVRYRVFGRHDACPVPDAGDADRFIVDPD